MTEREIAERVRKAMEDGAPAWGVEVLTEVLQLRAWFEAHVEEHKSGRATWRQIWLPAASLLALAVLVYVVAPIVARLTP